MTAKVNLPKLARWYLAGLFIVFGLYFAWRAFDAKELLFVLYSTRYTETQSIQFGQYALQSYWFQDAGSAFIVYGRTILAILLLLLGWRLVPKDEATA